MSTKLTKIDIDNLIDSVEIWEHHGELILQSHEAMRSMYTDPEQIAEFDAVTKTKRELLKKSIKVKKHQAIVLKYKLVKIGDSIAAAKALDKFGEIGEKDGGSR
jgi:C-terminal processing protease CtpA/Prc